MIQNYFHRHFLSLQAVEAVGAVVCRCWIAWPIEHWVLFVAMALKVAWKVGSGPLSGGATSVCI